ncbi:MAG: peptide deformylase [Pedosphaera sp.]|nr:peptide deformylase [Pedosphaera sp.]
MVLPLTFYGNPVLRKKGARVGDITPTILQLIADMIETMDASHGVGLAAQQVGAELQLTVLDVRGMKDRPSTMSINGSEADVEEHMPLVLINPEIQPMGDKVVGSEGCLSFPEIFGEIERRAEVEVTATNAKGKRWTFRCGGLLARAVQHEFDHLQGILFIDRMEREVKSEIKPELEELQAKTKAELKRSK